MKFSWLLPTPGDSRIYAGHNGRELDRKPSLGNLRAMASVAGSVGLDSMLLPVGLYCEDPWLCASAVADVAPGLRFTLALRPDSMHPVLAAHMSCSLARLFGPRFDYQLVAGGSPDEQAMFGDTASHDERYSRLIEFTHIYRQTLTGSCTHEGVFHRANGATLSHPYPSPTELPQIYVGGSSVAAATASASCADVYMTYYDGLNRVRARLETLPTDAGRLRIGVRLHVLARWSTEQAWSDAYALVQGESYADRAAELGRHNRKDSVGQKIMTGLSKDRTIPGEPVMWTGLAQVRGGSGITMVGSYVEIADAINTLSENGVDEIILSGHPNLEELYRFGECILPRLS